MAAEARVTFGVPTLTLTTGFSASTPQLGPVGCIHTCCGFSNFISKCLHFMYLNPYSTSYRQQEFDSSL